jgi:NAD-dependent SIR2 family protein deacetylase
MALQAKPNPAHYALAELAKRKEGFITLSQNVDGMWLYPPVHNHDSSSGINYWFI